MTLSHHTEYRLDAKYSQDSQDIAAWRAAMDQIVCEKMTWEDFLKGIPIAIHPARQLTTTKDDQSLLHLAVLFNRIDLAEQLYAHDPHLKLRRNRIGLTPLDLARFLPRKEIVSLLQKVPAFNFCNVPNVKIQDPVYFNSLHNLTLLPQPIFKSEKVFTEVLKLAARAKQEDEIPPDRIWMGIYFSNEIQTEIYPKISIRFIDEEVGFGAFAEQRILPCTFVGEYTGIIQRKKKKELEENVHCVRYTIWGRGKDKFVINAEEAGNFTRFINHSAKPNLTLLSVYLRGLPRMIFVSLREISTGEQLTFDYGPIFWRKIHIIPKIFS